MKQIQNDSINLKKISMFISMQKVNIINFFLRYYILKNLVIALVLSILAHNSKLVFCQIWVGGETSITTLVFILDYFQEKIMTKFSKKSTNTDVEGILGLFFPNLGKNKFFWEKRGQFFHKMPKWQTDRETDRRRETDNSDFIGISRGH